MTVLVALLAGCGAVMRVQAVGRLGGDERAILLINLAGSFALGLLTGAGAGSDAMLYAGTAVLGSFTTFSTWMLDEHRLLTSGDIRRAMRLLVVAVVGGAVAAAAGWALGSL